MIKEYVKKTKDGVEIAEKKKNKQKTNTNNRNKTSIKDSEWSLKIIVGLVRSNAPA